MGNAKKIQVKNNFLRKGYGGGGSPTQFDKAIVDEDTGQKMMMSVSHYSGDSPRKTSMIPVRRDNMTTVRVRTKNNSFVYGES